MSVDMRRQVRLVTTRYRGALLLVCIEAQIVHSFIRRSFETLHAPVHQESDVIPMFDRQMTALSTMLMIVGRHSELNSPDRRLLYSCLACAWQGTMHDARARPVEFWDRGA